MSRLLHLLPVELWCRVLEYLPAPSWHALGVVDASLRELINADMERTSGRRLCLGLLAQHHDILLQPVSKEDDLDLPNMPPPKSMSWFPLRLGIPDFVSSGVSEVAVMTRLFWKIGNEQLHLGKLMKTFVQRYMHQFPEDRILLTDSYFPSPVTKTTAEYGGNLFYVGPKLQDFGFFQYRNKQVHLPLSYVQFLVHFAPFFHALFKSEKFSFHGIKELRENGELWTLELAHLKEVSPEGFSDENRKGRFLPFCSLDAEFTVFIDVTEPALETFGCLYRQNLKDAQDGGTLFRIADGISHWIERLSSSQSTEYIDAISDSLSGCT
ncbi:hypothetical protein K493DRAFT_319267 [Basidiobolus meristosporus CBS 931.73]|uniref:F-box domain-containing protein n=1 Tax=Basidiobolus meristosporus CBS 931.73 TaxID=1314790 RepID=A0A1Y1XSL8_9FUNG|nr:hypothetical protein K493DRAFT_319267 [Basidiobolus meristosporus CBS 931.73]|eukprot:ORX88723.1 hypothetical protein K493DRAFT_319267 [Basidiobolus meristosporus CBS 931.73]